MGVETRLQRGEVQAIPLFEHALELDPDFALAAARLGAIYTNLRDVGQAHRGAPGPYWFAGVFVSVFFSTFLSPSSSVVHSPDSTITRRPSTRHFPSSINRTARG